MKRILFMINESRSANGICAKAVMEELVRKGYEVFSVTNKEYKSADSFEAGGVKYTCVKPRLVYRIYSYLQNSGVSGIKRKILTAVHNILSKTKLMISIFSWPLISPLYSCRIYKKAISVCENEHIDIIVPIYTQVDTLIAAKKIKNKMPQIKYVPYFLDSFSGGYGPKIFSHEWTVKRGLKWEKKLLPTADKIIMMSSAKPHYEKYSCETSYFSRIKFLDLPLFIPNDSSNDTEIIDSAFFNFLFIGTIPAHIRDPKPFIEAFKLTKDSTFRLTIIGTSTCEAYIESAVKSDDRIRVLPFIDHDSALSAMNKADILVNFGNNLSNMTPSKIFEYMSTGNPIITTFSVENEPSLRYIEKYPFYFAMNEKLSFEDNAEMIEAFAHSMKGKKADTSSIEKEFYLNTPSAFVDCIENDN